MGRNGHDGTRPVADEDVIGYPNRDFLPVHGVDAIASGKDARLVLGQVGTVQVALLGGGLDVCLHFISFSVDHELFEQGVFGSHNHVGRPEQSIGAGRVDFEFLVRSIDSKLYFGTLGSSDPRLLLALGRVGPVQVVQSGE